MANPAQHNFTFKLLIGNSVFNLLLFCDTSEAENRKTTMKKQYNFFLSSLALVCMLSLFACKSNNKQTPASSKLDELEWLLGDWQGEAEGNVFYENWVKVNDTLFSGESYFVSGSDTTGKEGIEIKAQDSVIYYIPTVHDQNEGQPVYFKLIISESRLVVFENQNHDFPQLISYKLTTSDSLVAQISGTSNGVMKDIRFPMKRKQQ